MAFPNVVQDINDLQAFQQNLINLIYPVGSIYMSMNNISPATFLGGTWEQIKDRFLLSAGSKEVGSTGGEETHTLSVAELPSHNHTASSNSTGAHTHTVIIRHDQSGYGVTIPAKTGYMKHASGSWNTTQQTDKNQWNMGVTGSGGAHSHTITINSTGSGTAHNNMPPYLTVYMWKRTS